MHLFIKDKHQKESTSSQWLIPFKKIRPCNLSLKSGETFIIFNNSGPVMTPGKGVHHWENQKIHWEFQHMFKFDPSWLWTVPRRLSPGEPAAFGVGQLVLHWGQTRTVMCNNGSLHQRMQKNVKSANYLQLQMEQILGTCQQCLTKN